MANPSTIFCSNFVAFLLCVQLERSTFYNWWNLWTFLVMAKINKIKTISFRFITQLTLTYSTLTIETLQKDVKYVQKLTVKTPEWRQ